MTKEKNIQFKIADIRTNEFATVDDIPVEDDKVEIKSGIGVNMDVENSIITVQIKFTFIFNNYPFVILNCQCSFMLDDKNLKSFANEDGCTYTFPKDLVTHLAVLTVGTARGILHCKTENTNYNKFILPPIDLTKIIKEDLKLKQ